MYLKSAIRKLKPQAGNQKLSAPYYQAAVAICLAGPFPVPGANAKCKIKNAKRKLRGMFFHFGFEIEPQERRKKQE